MEEAAARRFLGGDAVDVWWVDLGTWPAGVDVLPDEQQRADRMRDERGRARWLASRIWRRAILGRYLGVPPGRVAFAADHRGKPSLVDGGDLCFSHSRSAGLGLVAVTRRRAVGVDVEQVRSDVGNDGLADRFFSPAEAYYLRRLPEGARTDAFFGLWARKEAVVKASGAGLSDGLSHVDVRTDVIGGRWSVATLDVAPGFAAAVAVDGVMGPVSLHGPKLERAGPLRAGPRGGRGRR